MNAHALLVTDLVGSVIVIAGFAWSLLKLLPRIVRAVRGAVEGLVRFADFVAGNTAATERLTAVVTEVRDDIKAVVATLGEHGKRLDDQEERIEDLGGRVAKIEGHQDDGAVTRGAS